MSSIVAHDAKYGQIGQKRIWLPTECWVDTLKLLNRRQLLRGMQPACRRLHAISELPDMPNLHIIRNFAEFLDGLERNLPEANRQYENLTASKADLAQHFRLGTNLKLRVGQHHSDQNQAGYKRRCQIQMCVLRHSLELFRGCQLRLKLEQHSQVRSGVPADELLAYLSLLVSAHSFCIEVLHRTKLPGLHPDKLLREPTMLACPRLTFNFWQNIASAESIFHWLHHLSIEETKEENRGQNSTQTRILILSKGKGILPSTGADIIERCKQSLQQAESASDQRPFLLGFEILDDTLIPSFKLENGASGEVLQLKVRGQHYTSGGCEPRMPWTFYCLRRCPVAELANAEEFYRDTLDEGELMHIRVPRMDNGLEAPILKLR